MVLAGCKSGKIPDPNDPADVGLMSPQEVRRNLKAVADFLNVRVMTGDITDAEREKLIARRANELLKETDIAHIKGGSAWQYGEILIAARQWSMAKRVLLIAVQHPAREDRRVNDNLRLARCEAMLGEVPQAIARARSVFDTSKLDAAPILPAILLEIVPAGLGKGHDVELGNLLMDAIPQHERVYVDPKLGPGRDFLIAKPHHISHAYAEAIRIFANAGRPDLGKKARESFEKWARQNPQA